MDFERFDTRHYPTVPVREGYRDWVPSYEDTVEDRMDLALLDRIGTVAWSDVDRAADLGSGTGRTGKWLRSHGVDVLHGVDLTPEMLALAEGTGAYEVLEVADVRSTGLPTSDYGLVTCCLVDEHLESLSPLYREARRLLRPGGSFVVVGYHPFFIMRAGMPTHFDHPSRGPLAVRTFVHLFSDHVSAGCEAGFRPRELHEGLVDEEWIQMKPRWAEYRHWPISFAWVWQTQD